MKRILFTCIFLLLIPLTANAQKTLQDAVAATATGETLSIGSSTSNGVLAQVTGTFSGTITWRATFNGTDYVDVQATNLTTGTTATTATAAGLYSILAPRIVAFRAPVTTYASGSITVTAAAANGVARMGSNSAPIDATFITQTPSTTLTAEQALSALATGLLKNTTATGVLSIAGASDLPSGIDAAKIADGSVSNAEFQRLDGVTSGIQAQIDSKQAALGFTPENVANKSVDGALAGNSDTLYASQKATKTYADTKEVPLTFSSPLVRTVNAVACATCLVNGGALGSPSSAGTLPAFTLGGTVSGGGQQLNNVIIGTTTPLAGSFTTINGLAVTTNGTNTLNIAAAKALTVNDNITLASDGTGTRTLNVGTGGTLGSNAFTSTAYVPQTTTVNSKALSGNITLGLASSDFANQGTATTILHGNAAGNPAFGQVVNADITNGTIDLTTKVTGATPQANGGFGSDISASSGVPLFATGTPTFTSTSGSGNFVRVTSATLVSPTLGAALATSINGNTFTTGTYTLTGTAGKTLNFTNSITLAAGADGTTQTFPSTSQSIPGLALNNTWTRGQTITEGTANESILLSTGGSNTGSNTASALDLSWTLNTSGSPDVFALRVTDTARGASTKLLNLYAGASGTTSEFSINRSGDIVAAGGFTIGGGGFAYSTGTGNATLFNSSAFNWGSSGLGSPDIGVSRLGVNLLGVGTGGAGSFAGSLKLTDITAVGANVILSGIGSDATHTDNTVCVDSTSGLLYKGSGTLGICLGTSSARFKNSIHNLNEGLSQILALRPVNYFYDRTHGDGGRRLQYGFTAESTQKVLPVLVGLDSEGKPNSVDMLGMFPVMVKAMQEMHAEIESLKAEIQSLKQPRRIAFHLPSVIGL